MPMEKFAAHSNAPPRASTSAMECGALHPGESDLGNGDRQGSVPSGRPHDHGCGRAHAREDVSEGRVGLRELERHVGIGERLGRDSTAVAIGFLANHGHHLMAAFGGERRDRASHLAIPDECQSHDAHGSGFEKKASCNERIAAET